MIVLFWFYNSFVFTIHALEIDKHKKGPLKHENILSNRYFALHYHKYFVTINMISCELIEKLRQSYTLCIIDSKSIYREISNINSTVNKTFLCQRNAT